MHLSHLSLQHFRSWEKKSFAFSPNTTVIVGPNTAGKSNIVEAIYLFSTGKSFRAEKEQQLIQFGKEMARSKATIGDLELELVLTSGQVGGVHAPLKRYMVNGVAKRRIDFASHFPSVIFSPSDLEIIIGSPGLRRRLLDNVIEQVDREYAKAATEYTKALRQRNALLSLAKETGRRPETQLHFWDETLIKTGTILTKKREVFIAFVNASKKSIFDFTMIYDHSIISVERLLQYKEAEVGAGVTLVGPHRDDFFLKMYDKDNEELHEIKSFASRGQQRLAIMQLKMLEIAFIEETLGTRPALLLDDIFSELDEGHIRLLLTLLGRQQTIITTTHKELLPPDMEKDMHLIELRQENK